MIRRGSLLSNAWLVSGASLGSVAVLVVLLWSMGSRPSITGKSLRLFCAAGIAKPMRDIIRDYEREYGVTVQADYGGTNELIASIAKIGVQGDLFLSADSTTAPSSSERYARMRSSTAVAPGSQAWSRLMTP